MERVDGRTDGWMDGMDGRMEPSPAADKPRYRVAGPPAPAARCGSDGAGEPPPLGSSQHDEERCNIRRPSKDYSSTDHVS
uniref:Uncharacterized protein n=2 Tax=Oryza TaxID=4527 RepID=A0A0E0GTC4_ORYNI